MSKIRHCGFSKSIKCLGVTSALLALAFSACTSSLPARNTLATADLIATELQFAAYARENGTNAAFIEFIDDEGVLFRPYAVNGKERLAQQTNRIGPPYLKWWPAYSGAARSGDLGFNTGPYTVGDDQNHGYFFTVWQKQDDQRWKFLIDHGVRGEKDRRHAEGYSSGNVTHLTVSPAGDAVLKRQGGYEAQRRAEAEFFALAAEDPITAYRQYLDRNAWLLRDDTAPATRSAGHMQVLRSRSSPVTLSTIDGRASSAGDLVYTYGTARWNNGDGLQYGVSVRVWQLQSAGWRIVADVLTSAPAPE